MFKRAICFVLLVLGSLSVAGARPTNGNATGDGGNMINHVYCSSVANNIFSHGMSSGQTLPDYMYASAGSNNALVTGGTASTYVGMIGYMSTKVKTMGPCTNSNLIVASDVGTGTTVQANVMILNGTNASIIAGPTGVGPATSNTTKCNGHDCSFVLASWDGQSIISNLAATVHAVGTLTGLKCMSTTGIAGTAEACQPAYFGSNLLASTDPGSFLNTSNQGVIAANFSEGTSGQTCYEGKHNCVVLAGGQVQASWFSMGIRAGQQDFVVGRINGDGVSGITFDSACPGNTQTITYGFSGSYTGAADSTICNEEYVPTDMPQSDYVGTAIITTNPTSTWGFNPPAPFTCTTALTGIAAGADARTSAANGVAAYNGAAGTAAGCPNTRVIAYAVTSSASAFTGTASECSQTTFGCMGFGVKDRDPENVSASGSVNCTGTAIVCRVWNNSGTNLLQTFAHFEFGGSRPDPYLCPNCFVLVAGIQPDTTLYNGTASNGPNLAIGLFSIEILQPGPGVEVCALDLTNCQDIILGTTPQTEYRKLGSGGGGTAASNGLSDPTEPGQPDPSLTWCTTTPAGHGKGTCNTGTNNPFLMRPCSNIVTNFPGAGTPPFFYGWGMDEQINSNISAVPHGSANNDLAFAQGHVYYLWNALDTEATPKMATMMADVSTSNRQVTCSFVQQSVVTSYENIPISAMISQLGTFVVTMGIPNAASWTSNPNLTGKTGLGIVQYTSTTNSPPYTAWNPGTIIQSFTGTVNASAPLSNLADDDYSLHVYDLYQTGTEVGCTTNCPNIGFTDHYTP